LLAGEPRRHPSFRSIRPLRAPTSHLRHDVASSFAADSHLRAVQFALPFPLASTAVFRRSSFGRDLSSSAARDACRTGTSHGGSGTAARVGCRPPAPFGWGSRTRRRDLWHPLSLRDRSREGSVPLVRPSSPSFVGSPVQPRCQDPTRHRPVRASAGLSPGRLPSARFSTLRPSEESRGPCYVLAKLLAPLSPDSFGPSSSGTGRRPALSRAASVCLSAPLRGAKKMLLTDFCNRLTIRAPVNRSITERTTCVALTPQALPLAVPGAETPNPTSVRPAWRRTILRQSDPGWPRA